MNEKFYNLPVEKQKRIINAAYKVFSQNNYKKAPMSEIADEGGISKALLFHYFTNKKELYLFLWKNAIKMTSDVSKEYQVVDTDDFFEMLKRSLFAKCSLMKNYHHIYAFCLNAYYEQYPEIKSAIQESFLSESQMSESIVFEKIDVSVFRTDIDWKTMYAEIIYAVDGYMLSKYRSDGIVADQIEQEMSTLIDLWKTVYTKKEI